MAIGTVEFDLSMVNPDTGLYNTARMYTIDGVNNVDGTPRELSIGQLVMAICLQRASQLENGYDDPVTGEHVNGIIDLMNNIEHVSAQLEAMTTIESAIIEEFQNDTSGHSKALNDIAIETGQTAVELLRELGVLDEYQCNVSNTAQTAENILYDEFITKIESKMDEKNSFNQKTMIELQSLTNKRDQSYDMVSNVLKSLNTVLVGIANNT